MLFPIFLKLAGRPVLVVGGGKVAAAKLDALLAAGARVRVVAPEVGNGMERPGVTVERRQFAARDLDGAAAGAGATLIAPSAAIGSTVTSNRSPPT